MTDIFDTYKPLRNYLRKVGLIESLGVIRAYVQHFQFGALFPPDIEVPDWFLQARSNVDKKVFEWELDVLARELLIHASPLGPPDPRYTLRRWSYFAGAVNKLKDLENEIVSLYPQGSILLELHRIAHREFPWQRPPNATWLSRYYRIFSYPDLDAVLHGATGLTARELYLLGLAFAGLYLDQFALYYPPTIEIPGLTRDHFDRFLKHFALDLEQLRARTAAAQELNDNYPYVFNPLRVHPIVGVELRGRLALVAPIPTFLFWRFTEGVYYELLNQPSFANAYGEAFQRYVGDVIERANRTSRLQFYPEVEYRIGKDRKDSVDWILEDDSGLLFVESKTKRLQLRAKTEIRSTEALESELDKLATFIVQLYKTIADYRSGHYPHVPYRPGKPVYPLVLTLEEWFSFGPRIHTVLDQRVAVRLEEADLPREWLNEMSYSTCSVAAFEKLVQVVDARPIAEVMGRKIADPEFRGWLLDGFLSHAFPAESHAARNLFPETLDELTAAIAPNAQG
ncbi:MAG TPA: hypothetical protein VJO34_13350 [Methylomirabilota bacterium]|nr:hypothetical protein [Methylomirabilota bacterium]